MANFIIRERQNNIIYLETFLTAIGLAFGIWKLTGHPWAIAIITFLGIMYGFLYGFFKWRIFRYIITVFYSMLWGFLAFFIGHVVGGPYMATTGLVFGYLAYFLSIYLHINHFDFIKSATVIEVDHI